MKIAWAFTGAGHLLLESVKLLEETSKSHHVTVLLSGAGEEVLKMYGLFDRVKAVTGGYYQELVFERAQSHERELRSCAVLFGHGGGDRGWPRWLGSRKQPQLDL